MQVKYVGTIVKLEQATDLGRRQFFAYINSDEGLKSQSETVLRLEAKDTPHWPLGGRVEITVKTLEGAE